MSFNKAVSNHSQSLEWLMGSGGIVLCTLAFLRIHPVWPILFILGGCMLASKWILGRIRYHRLQAKYNLLDQQFEELRQRQQISFNEAPIGIAHLDKSGYWVKSNDTLSLMTGYSENELTNMTFLDITHDLDREAMKIEFDKLADRKCRTIDFEKRYKHKNKHDLWVRLVAAPIICNANLSHYLVIIQDVSDRVKFEAKMELTRNMAIKANRAKDEFLSIMSHELRTPLNSILGFSSLLKEDPEQPLNDVSHDYISRIHGNGKHLLGLINNILDLAKIGTGHVELNKESFSLEKLIEDTSALLTPIARPKNLNIELHFHEESIILNTDPNKLKQVLINLINNSIKFTDKGSIDIYCHSNSAGNIIIQVQDTGIGMKVEDSEQIFNSFNQIDSGETRKYNGAGLGLSICKALIEIIGGKISVNSEVGKGSTFTIELPGHIATIVHAKINGQTQDIEPEDDSNLVQDKECNSCLVIDDDEDCCCLYENYFERLGIKCIVATSSEKGLQAAVRHKPDIILCDINIPKMSGSEILMQLRSNIIFQSTPIIAQTAHALKHDREKYLDEGFDGYLSKPVSMEKLSDLIHHHFTLSPCIEKQAVS